MNRHNIGARNPLYHNSVVNTRKWTNKIIEAETVTAVDGIITTQIAMGLSVSSIAYQFGMIRITARDNDTLVCALGG
jgi:hypothetical protein